MRTSTQIAFSSLIIMFFIFSMVGFTIYHQLADYILDRSMDTINAVITQTQARLNSALREVDTYIQQFCNDMAIQEILWQSKQNQPLTSENSTTIRRQVMNTLNYVDSIENFEVYSPIHRIYPLPQNSIEEILTDPELNLVNEQNGKIVWLSNSYDSFHTIRAAKKILLPDYGFAHGGYLIFEPKSDFLDFLAQDFSNMNGILLILKDSTGEELYRYTNVPSLTPEHLNEDDYRSIQSVSPYSKWELTFYIPNTLQEQDIPWLTRTLAFTFGIGAILFMLACIFISRMLCAPLKDMEKAMIITGSRLAPNPKWYANSDINNLNAHYNHLVAANNHLIDEVYEKELLRTKAEIEALQAQVNPHFIINALESMYWVLIQKGDIENSKILLSLAHLFQYILKGKDWIFLEEELYFIEQYLQIEAFRFGSKLSWSYNIQSDLKKIKIPKLLIHPLVENAVKYAVETTTKNIHIQIQITGSPDDYQIIVSDNGTGINPETLEKLIFSFQDDNPVGSVSNSYGLANLYKRIKLYFGKDSSLKIITAPLIQGTTVEMRIHSSKNIL